MGRYYTYSKEAFNIYTFNLASHSEKDAAISPQFYKDF